MNSNPLTGKSPKTFIDTIREKISWTLTSDIGYFGEIQFEKTYNHTLKIKRVDENSLKKLKYLVLFWLLTGILTLLFIQNLAIFLNIITISLSLSVIIAIEAILLKPTINFYRENNTFAKEVPLNVENEFSGYIDQIVALQLIHPKLLLGKLLGNKYYALYLVLKDRTRHALLARDDCDSLKSDAEIIANFLTVPIWDFKELEDNSTRKNNF